MTELLELRAVVEAAPDTVAGLLLDVRPGGRSPIATSGTIEETDTGDDFVVVRDGSRLTVQIDRAARAVSQQGEWWYRGVTSVEPDPRGCQLVHRIFNVATGHGWAVRFVSRGPLLAAPAQFATQVHQIATELDVPAWVLET
ncbi:MAG: hypothetical protein ABW046_21110 [Actinoplanes sp.]